MRIGIFIIIHYFSFIRGVNFTPFTYELVNSGKIRNMSLKGNLQNVSKVAQSLFLHKPSFSFIHNLEYFWNNIFFVIIFNTLIVFIGKVATTTLFDIQYSSKSHFFNILQNVTFFNILQNVTNFEFW